MNMTNTCEAKHNQEREEQEEQDKYSGKTLFASSNEVNQNPTATLYKSKARKN